MRTLAAFLIFCTAFFPYYNTLLMGPITPVHSVCRLVHRVAHFDEETHPDTAQTLMIAVDFCSNYLGYTKSSLLGLLATDGWNDVKQTLNFSDGVPIEKISWFLVVFALLTPSTSGLVFYPLMMLLASVAANGLPVQTIAELKFPFWIALFLGSYLMFGSSRDQGNPQGDYLQDNRR